MLLSERSRKVIAEFIGTGLLVVAVVGSGIAAQRLSPGDTGLQLLENAAATGAALVAIILAVGPVSGAHLNPAVTLADRVLGGMSTGDAGAYIAAQVGGGAIGAVTASVMFSEPTIAWSTTPRSGSGLWPSRSASLATAIRLLFDGVRAPSRSVSVGGP